MKQEKSFFRTVCNLAIPVALQSMLQASFSIVDQIMIGQLGSVSVAGVGLAGKFSSIFSVVVAAIGTVAGIMVSQYMGQKNKSEVRRSFYINLYMAIGLAVVFSILCAMFPGKVMGLYSKDADTIAEAAGYLRIVTGTFLPIAGATLLSTMFRCMEKTSLPLYASIVAALLNTGLNYVLIFGKFGVEPMGATGAAIATVIAQLGNFLIMLVLFLRYKDCISKENGKQDKTLSETTNVTSHKENDSEESLWKNKFNWSQYLSILMPILVCEFLWSLGENIYAAIYGHLGTDACAAMTLINPIQGLMIGALCGLSQAAGVLIGKRLGNKEYDEAYEDSKKLIFYGFAGAIILSIVIILTRGLYVKIYQVEDTVKTLTKQILLAYALVAPFKVQNMIVGGGILQSGGKTQYVMMVDMIGTWIFGVPLGLLTAFVFNLSIPYVYFILSLEECVRYAISLVIFKKKIWMQSLE